MNKIDVYLGFKKACKSGHIEIVKYLLETFKDPDMYKYKYYFGFGRAC